MRDGKPTPNAVGGYDYSGGGPDMLIVVSGNGEPPLWVNPRHVLAVRLVEEWPTHPVMSVPAPRKLPITQIHMTTGYLFTSMDAQQVVSRLFPTGAQGPT